MYKNIRIILTLSLILIQALWSVPFAFAQDNTPQVRITQVDNSRFPRVTVYISVTNAAGEPVGVDPNNIQILENGQVIKTESVTGAGDIGSLTTLLVIDTSGSMEMSKKMDGAKEAAKAYIDQMRPGDKAGLVAFNTDIKVVQSVTDDHQALTKAIDSLQPIGNTAMFDALTQSAELLSGVSGRKTIILLSDGLDNRSRHTVDDVIKSIGPAGLSISTIGLGDPKEPGNNYGLDEPALRSLAQQAGGAYSFSTDPAALASIYQQYGRALQSEYTFTYLSPSTLRDGVNRGLTVSLNGGAATTTSIYNPGGVLPEVANQSWPLFGGILLGLLVLLALPCVIGSNSKVFSGFRKKGRVKLTQPSSDMAAKGRVRMK